MYGVANRQDDPHGPRQHPALDTEVEKLALQVPACWARDRTEKDGSPGIPRHKAELSLISSFE
jgi:hypothetical protein